MPLDRRVLVLNRLWQPVHICSARRAFVLLYLEHAQVVDSDGGSVAGTYGFGDWIVQGQRGDNLPLIGTPSASFPVPSVIVLSTYDRLPKREVKFTRENILRRDDYTCQYCEEKKSPKQLNIDHVIPREKGGQHEWDNVVCSCIPCNTLKANKLPEQAGMIPRRKPQAPRWRPLAAIGKFDQGTIDESWSLFLCGA